jgi:hypothetical protein
MIRDIEIEYQGERAAGRGLCIGDLRDDFATNIVLSGPYGWTVSSHLPKNLSMVAPIVRMRRSSSAPLCKCILSKNPYTSAEPSAAGACVSRTSSRFTPENIVVQSVRRIQLPTNASSYVPVSKTSYLL